MATFVDIEQLPHYKVCTVEELIAAQDTPSSACDSVEWVPCPQNNNSSSASDSSAIGKFKFNKKGRAVLVTAQEREIVICAHRKPGAVSSSLTGNAMEDYDVFAYDRNCYHVGYPLDLGDIEDIPVKCASSGEEFHVTCINCPLHNRIFDLASGDLVTITHSGNGEALPFVVPRGKRRGGVPSTHGCHQRVHPVTIIEEDDGKHRIQVFDTFGKSNATTTHSSTKECTTSSTGKVVQETVDILSDKYNPVGSLESFHEFDPKKGNSFVNFRGPEQAHASSGGDGNENSAEVVMGSAHNEEGDGANQASAVVNSTATTNKTKTPCCVVV